MKKYEFTGETIQFEGHTLRRIRFLRNVGFIMKGSIGGWIEGEHNLSQEDECRVLDEAKVFGNARIMNNAKVRGFSIVKDNAQLLDESYADNYAIIGADTIVSDSSHIIGKSKIFFYAHVHDSDFPNISGESSLLDCHVEGTGKIHECDVKRLSLFGGIDLFFDKEH